MIWKTKRSTEEINDWCKGTLMTSLGIDVFEVSDDYLRARMPVDHRTHNPMKILHGGATVALAETVGSIASWLVVDDEKIQPVGLEINANHLRSESSGWVYAIARPIKLGKQTHLWDIRVTNQNNDLVCICRFTIFLRSAR